MMRTLFPSCTQENFYNFYLWASVVPFNLLRCIAAILVTLPIYKRISRLINSVSRRLDANANANASPVAAQNPQAQNAQPDDGNAPAADGRARKAAKINLAAIITGAAVLALIVLFVLLRHFVFKA